MIASMRHGVEEEEEEELNSTPHSTDRLSLMYIDVVSYHCSSSCPSLNAQAMFLRHHRRRESVRHLISSKQLF